MVESLASHYEFDTTQPFEELPAEIRDVVLYGSGKTQIKFLQLVIDPTCSIVFEVEKEDPDIMTRPPRPPLVIDAAATSRR